MSSGPPPDIDPAYAAETNFPRMMAINGTFHGIAIIFLALRLYVRVHLLKSFGIDDAVMILAWLFLFGGGMVTQIIAGTHGALGRHADAVTVEEMEMYGMMSFVQGVCMTVTSICLLKFSIALSLLRLNNQKKWYKWILWGLMVFIFCYMILGWVSLLAFCKPVEAHWDKEVFKTATCYPRETANLFASLNTGEPPQMDGTPESIRNADHPAAFNIFTDVAFATIPIPMLWALQTKLRVRIYLIAIFNLGYIAVGIGIVKLIFQLITRGEPDKTFHNWIQFFGLLQQNVGMITACAPMLKPLVARTLKLQSSYATPSGPSGYGGRQRPTAAGYIREDTSGFEMSKLQGGVSDPYHTTVKGGISDDGSETSILAEGLQHRVMRHTEITVEESGPRTHQ
ncbi:hypothetical protein ACRALDRAFT_1069604 [Sodiomyces alcalophilus JCM 7366]|uniref:uncharacterized protein n=1 Tax=Sodiomyces alcalophilus JCM 7366 TaxID=591952 RepID=UPI0039B5DC9B